MLYAVSILCMWVVFSAAVVCILRCLPTNTSNYITTMCMQYSINTFCVSSVIVKLLIAYYNGVGPCAG